MVIPLLTNQDFTPMLVKPGLFRDFLKQLVSFSFENSWVVELDRFW